jgi:hypothetical protein
MLSKIHTFRSRRMVIPALVCAAALCGGYMVGRAAAPQPHMRAALDHLQAAKVELQTAEADKGGHRAKAIKLVDEAIGEVTAGMEYSQTH